ncbi:hypothetical protein KAI52_00885 [Candidatus Parcubacteria bacterium]|nr:hypothetical protein [Candidatus Parcubacteria bacterium]
MSKKVSVKNILVPVGIFLYFPVAFYAIFIIWSEYYDIFVKRIYSAASVFSAIISFVFLFTVTAFLVSVVFKEVKKDKKFIILSAVPIFMFFSLYFVRFFK